MVPPLKWERLLTNRVFDWQTRVIFGGNEVKKLKGQLTDRAQKKVQKYEGGI